MRKRSEDNPKTRKLAMFMNRMSPMVRERFSAGFTKFVENDAWELWAASMIAPIPVPDEFVVPPVQYALDKEGE